MLFFAKADTCVRQLQMYELISFTRQGFASLFFFNRMFRLISQPRFALKPQTHRRRLSFCAFGDIKTKKSSKTKSFSKILHNLSKVFTNFVLSFFENTSRCTSTAKSAGFADNLQAQADFPFHAKTVASPCSKVPCKGKIVSFRNETHSF